jgi:uncharacterized membrane protein YgcG
MALPAREKVLPRTGAEAVEMVVLFRLQRARYRYFGLEIASRTRHCLRCFRASPQSTDLNREDNMKNIYVGNLDFRTSEEELRTLFEGYGTVERVNMIRDRDTGQPRGFAFVEMTNDAEAEKAVAGTNGSSVGGRNLNVSEARPKPERGAGGGGGAGGGRGGRGGGGGGGGRGGYGGGGGGGGYGRGY